MTTYPPPPPPPPPPRRKSAPPREILPPKRPCVVDSRGTGTSSARFFPLLDLPCGILLEHLVAFLAPEETSHLLRTCRSFASSAPDAWRARIRHSGAKESEPVGARSAELWKLEYRGVLDGLAMVKLQEPCLRVIEGLMTGYGWVFSEPVDPVELALPDYFDIIERPMDLGTIKRRLIAGNYCSLGDFDVDVRLTFENAMTYSEHGTAVHDMAAELMRKYSQDFSNVKDRWKSHMNIRSRKKQTQVHVRQTVGTVREQAFQTCSM